MCRMSENNPAEIMTMIARYSNLGNLVYDGSAGTAVTANCCLRMGRYCIVADPDTATMTAAKARSQLEFIKLQREGRLVDFGVKDHGPILSGTGDVVLHKTAKEQLWSISTPGRSSTVTTKLRSSCPTPMPGPRHQIFEGPTKLWLLPGFGRNGSIARSEAASCVEVMVSLPSGTLRLGSASCSAGGRT